MADTITKQESSVPVRRRQLLSQFDAMQDTMDRVMDDFFGNWPMMRVRPREWRLEYFTPSMDVIDEENQVLVNLEVPGMNPDDIDITLAAHSVIIAGEKKSERQEERQGAQYTERRYGSFRREIPIDEGIERNRIEANFKNGVLTLTLPKSREALRQTRKIRIRSEGQEKPAGLQDLETMGAAEAIEQQEYPERDPYRQKQAVKPGKDKPGQKPADLWDTDTVGAAEAIEQQEQSTRTKPSK